MTRRGGLTAEDRRLWARVARSVEPRPGRDVPGAEPAAAPAPPPATRTPPKFVKPAWKTAAPTPRPPVAPPRPQPPRPAVDELEPRRQRRLARERDPIEARLDLHGHGRWDAQDALTAFLVEAQARGCRAVLVITGRGSRGGGVIRASVHEWLQAPALRGVVAGFAAAHRRHGGDGAIYVTLKRRS